MGVETVETVETIMSTPAAGSILGGHAAPAGADDAATAKDEPKPKPKPEHYLKVTLEDVLISG